MTFFPMIPIAWFAEVGFGEPTANKGDHAYFRSRSRQNPHPATRLGKTFWKPFIMAIPSKKAAIMPKPTNGLGKIEAETVYHGDHALIGSRSRQNPRGGGWGKSNGNPFIMAILQEKAGITPKPAAFNRLGKTQCETRLSWRS